MDLQKSALHKRCMIGHPYRTHRIIHSSDLFDLSEQTYLQGLLNIKQELTKQVKSKIINFYSIEKKVIF